MTKCTKGFDVQVLRSGAGYYIGTLDEGFPNCRISESYWKGEDEASTAISTGFTHRVCVENQFCNKGKSCLGGKA